MKVEQLYTKCLSEAAYYIESNGEVAIIDTENTFRPERIISMSKALDLDPDEVLSKIHVGRAYNSHQQMLMVEKVSEIAKERPHHLYQ